MKLRDNKLLLVVGCLMLVVLCFWLLRNHYENKFVKQSIDHAKTEKEWEMLKNSYRSEIKLKDSQIESLGFKITDYKKQIDQLEKKKKPINESYENDIIILNGSADSASGYVSNIIH